MNKTMLVCTDGSAYADTACEYAVALAGPLGARLTGLHVMDSRVLEGPLMADISGWIGASPYAAQLPQFSELLQQKSASIMDAFRDRCAQAGRESETLVKTGHPAREILDEAGAVDWLVLGQKGEHGEFVGESLGSIAERVVRHAPGSCLVCPELYRGIRRILVAYDASPHAKQALTQAVEWARSLGAELTVVSVEEAEASRDAAACAREGAVQAKTLGVEARAQTARGKAGPVLLEQAVQGDADLIVIGAFGHTRIREFILGSAAAHVLTHASVPVLMVR